MKEIQEIGIKRAIYFILFSILQLIYALVFLPQLRRLFLILEGATIGKSTTIMNVKFFNWHQQGFKNLKIGNECFIGDETLIDLYGEINLENQVTLAQRVTVLSHINVGFKDHPLQIYFPKKVFKTEFGEGSVIGAASTILPGVTIGKRSFVAAGSTVTKDVPDATLVAGVPAKVIRKLE